MKRSGPGRPNARAPRSSGHPPLIKLPEMPISTVCLSNTIAKVPIAKSYEEFVASLRGVGTTDLFDAPGFRLDVSKPIDDGSSWQLGAFIAHALHAAGRLAHSGD